MGLIAWWKLNGLLDDSSNNKNTLTNNGAVVKNEGKTGKCYTFNGTSSHMTATNKINSNSFSICAWVYPTTNVGNQTVFCSRSVMGSGVVIFLMPEGIRLDSGGHQWTTGISLPINTWSHLTYICEPNSKQLYVNGVLKANVKESTSIKDTHTLCHVGASLVSGSSEANFFKGHMNDIRVFSHSLSQKEVYEISKGKVLHLNFNTNKEATKNFVQLPTVSALYSTPGSYKPGWDNAQHPGAIKVNYWSDVNTGQPLTQYHAYWMYDDNGVTPICCMQDLPNANHNNARPGWLGSSSSVGTPTANGWKVGDKVTLSVIAKTSSLDKGIRFGIYHNEGGTNGFNNGAIQNMKCTKINTWETLSFTFTITSAWDLNQGCVMYIYGDNSSGGSGVLYWKSAQVEVKDHATPIVSGTHNPILYDLSGFNNHATISQTTTPIWVTDSKRGNGSYKFSGAQSISVPKFMFDDVNQEWTVCAWVKLSENGVNAIFLDNINSGNRLSNATTNTKPILYANDNLYQYGANDIPLNTWTHIAYVFSKPKALCQIYINGTLSGSLSNFTSDKLPKGFPSSHIIGEKLKGNIDDYRMYSTALSATDIMDIYQSVIEIDNQGNLFCNKHEEDANNLGFTAQGLVSFANLNEAFTVGDTYVLDDTNTQQVISGEWDSVSKKMQYKGVTSFVCNGITIPTEWSNTLAVHNLKNRVIFSNMSDTICCNELYEN